MLKYLWLVKRPSSSPLAPRISWQVLQLVNCVEEIRTRPRLFLLGQLLLTTQETIIFGIEGGKFIGALEARQRLRHRGIGSVVALKNILAELRAESRDIIRVFPEPFDDRGLVRHAHFEGIKRRTARLIFEQRGAAIPELPADILARRIPAERRREAGISCSRRIAVAQRNPIVAERDVPPDLFALPRIGKTGSLHMAGGTGHGAVHRKVGIVEQRSTELFQRCVIFTAVGDRAVGSQRGQQNGRSESGRDKNPGFIIGRHARYECARAGSDQEI